MKIYVSLSKKNKKLLKYAILFILGCILIYYSSILNVKAYTYENSPISNIQPPANLAMYNLTSSNTYSAISFSNEWTFSSENAPVYYSSRLNSNLILQTYGMGITLQTNMSLQAGSTYSLTMVFGTTSNSYILGSEYSSYGVKVGVSDGWNAISRPAELISRTSNSSLRIDNSDFLVGSSYIMSFNMTFKPNYSGSYIFTSFSSSESTTLTSSNWEFLGYYLSYVGEENITAGDVAASVDATLQDDFANVDDKLSALDETLSDVGTSIDEQTQQDQQQHEETMDTIQDNLNNCRDSYNLFNKEKITTGQYINENGNIIYSGGNYLSDFISINSNEKYYVNTGSNNPKRILYFDDTKNFISRQLITISGGILIIPENAKYIKLSGYIDDLNNTMLSKGTTALNYEPYGQEICTNKIDETNDKLDDLNDSINSSDTSGADNEANSFFNDFESNDFGLSDIITLPLTTIQSITSKSCTPLSLTLPFVNKTFELPCMTTIYSKFEPFYSIYQTITFGVISYWVCVQIYAMVKGFKDPTKDEIEVMDL